MTSDDIAREFHTYQVRPTGPQIVLDNANNWLYRHRSDVTSQAGENGIIAKILEIIGARNRWCMEIGAGDGRYFSNTWPLIHDAGWSAVLFEQDPERFQQLTTAHAAHPGVHGIQGAVTFDGEASLDALLKQAGAPSDIDLVSIDVDGPDYHLWDSLKATKPRVVVIEFNPTIPTNIVFVQKRDLAVQQGASLTALVELGLRKGYELVACTWLNAFFVQRADFAAFNIADNTPRGMGFDLRGDQMFYLYDGTIVKTGEMILPWQGIRLDLEDLQILPRAQRVFRPQPRWRSTLSALIRGEQPE